MQPNVRAPAIEVAGLTKTYKSKDSVVEAVRGIDLRVEAGQTYGFLGPNGAGKSTTIEMLCTIRNPDAGHRPGRRLRRRPPSATRSAAGSAWSSSSRPWTSS